MKYTADTSFFIGLFTKDKKNEYLKKLFYYLKENREKVFVPLQTIIGVVETLEYKYKMDRFEILNYIFAILSNYTFYVEKNELFYRSILIYEKYPDISIRNILISEESKERKITKILTVDRSYKYLDISVVKELRGGENGKQKFKNDS